MQKYVIYAAFGWLAASGLLHFVIDVAAQYVRGKRPPGVETTLYYGLNSAFSLGQVAFGALGLYAAFRALPVISDVPVLVLSVAAGIGWLTLAVFFMEYREPRLMSGIFVLLVLVAIVTRVK